MQPFPHNKIKNKYLVIFLAVLFTLSVANQAIAGRPDSFADLAEKLGPSVVNIYTTQVVKAENRLNEFFFNHEQNIPDAFKHFFGLPNHPKTPPREMKKTSLGSGIIITADGYIITNNHVVENATEINIRLTNLKEYEAKIIGRDSKTDLALLKIEADEKLPTVTFGNSDKLRVGDWVLAIGNPFGFEQTVTAGIVSGKGRHLGGAPYENFIQTDASINPGNSGGPLFDTKGRMVGINTAIYSRSGGNIGIGFAIPINMANNVITQLKEHGQVERGWLGVMIQHVTQELADQFKLDRPIGALVGEVSPGSPAEKAGIKQGDIIIAFNGMEILQMSGLPSLVAQTPVGTKVKVELVRKGEKKTLTVILGKLKEDHAGIDSSETTTEEKVGLTVQELTKELAQSLGMEDSKGVVITNVEAGTPAGDAGLRRGDIVLEANRKAIENIDHFKKALDKKDKNILLLIKRGKHSSYVVLKRR